MHFNHLALSEATAQQRLREEGYNELPSGKASNLYRIVFRVLSEPMFLLLLTAAGIYLVLGDVGEAVILSASVLLIIVITTYQEYKTERVLEALRDLASPRALVVRGGIERRISGREVVRGDILKVREGDRVPADARLLSSVDLQLDESLLTGESVPVSKEAAPVQQSISSAHVIYSGTLLVRGQGWAQVIATGKRTEMGKIGLALQALKIESTALQRETRRLVRNLAIVGVALCLIVAVVYAVTRHDALHGLLAGLTLAMAILPEEFPVVLTVFLALGAWRMSKQNVLTRRIPAIEALGAATVLCVDKTGTLTQNRMSIRAIHTQGETIDLAQVSSIPARFAEVIAVGALASEPEPFDPMERAFIELAPPRELTAELRHRYPFSPELMAVTHVWRFNKEKKLIVTAKGAPEAMIALCRLKASDATQLLDRTTEMAKQGLRVLACARAEWHAADLPTAPAAFEFNLVGIVGLADPIRPSVPAALQECRNAGVRVVMITGDYPVTALAISRDIGLSDRSAVLTGDELVQLSDSELQQRIREIDIFARVVPEQKLRIVMALKSLGEVVAMTGDGVNDAPALKAAHIGIAMGGRGTDVAREAAAIVLLDDDFASIVAAIRQGRRIFENLRRAMSYILAVHIPTVGLTLLPVFLGWPLLFFPVHIVFLEFIIDPACSIAFEAEPADENSMRRPPRDASQRLFAGWNLIAALVQGSLAMLFVLMIYQYGHYMDRSENQVRALAFTAIVLANLCLIFINRPGVGGLWQRFTQRNHALWWIVAGTFVVYALVLSVAPIREQFRFAPIPIQDLGVLVVALMLTAIMLVRLGRISSQ